MNFSRALYSRLLTPAGIGIVLFTGGCSTPPPPPTPQPVPVVRPAPAVSIVTAPGGATPVLLVQATSSAPNDREREYAEKITQRMAEWLREAGIPIKLVTDDQFSKISGTGAKAALFPYNPKPGPAQLQACRTFVGQGGKLIVLYSTEPQLASLMGLKLGAFKNAPGTDIWRAFSFIDGAPAGVPPRIEQNSRNIMPAFPAEAGAKVIAWWETTPGHPQQRDPAWTQSSRGFWMSHVLLEGDAILKEQLLVSLLGACDGDLWKVAAAQTLNKAGTLNKYRSAAQAMESIRQSARRGGQESRVLTLLTRAEALERDLVTLYHQGDYPRMLTTARSIDSLLTEAAARTQVSQPREFRGLWNHSGTGFTPGKWDDTCRTLVHNGLTAIFPNVQKPWAADYPSKLIPASDVLTRLGDQMEACLKATHNQGLETHAWVILWSLAGAPETSIAPYRREGRLQVTSSGKTINWMCPSHPANRAFELSAIHELAARYPKLDGIHLDYIRYQASDTCYCGGCKVRFTKATGIHPRQWPADVRSGPQAAAYREWRREQITGFVSDTRRDLKRLNPRMKLSASVYPLYPGVRDSIGQDWGEWVRRGLVDFVCPMSYTANLGKYTEWYRAQTAHPGVRGKLYPGIGVTTSECRLNAVETMDQINALRREGATGFTLFEANPTMEKEILPYLGMGITAP